MYKDRTPAQAVRDIAAFKQKYPHFVRGKAFLAWIEQTANDVQKQINASAALPPEGMVSQQAYLKAVRHVTDNVLPEMLQKHQGVITSEKEDTLKKISENPALREDKAYSSYLVLLDEILKHWVGLYKRLQLCHKEIPRGSRKIARYAADMMPDHLCKIGKALGAVWVETYMQHYDPFHGMDSPVDLKELGDWQSKGECAGLVAAGALASGTNISRITPVVLQRQQNQKQYKEELYQSLFFFEEAASIRSLFMDLPTGTDFFVNISGYINPSKSTHVINIIKRRIEKSDFIEVSDSNIGRFVFKQVTAAADFLCLIIHLYYRGKKMWVDKLSFYRLEVSHREPITQTLSMNAQSISQLILKTQLLNRIIEKLGEKSDIKCKRNVISILAILWKYIDSREAKEKIKNALQEEGELDVLDAAREQFNVSIAPSKNVDTFIDAVKSGNWFLVQQYLKKGSDILVMTKQGESVIHLAARDGHVDIIALILQGMADKEKKRLFFESNSQW